MGKQDDNRFFSFCFFPLSQYLCLFSPSNVHLLLWWFIGTKFSTFATHSYIVWHLVFYYLQFLSFKSHKLYVIICKEKFVRQFIHFYFKCYSQVSRMARAAAACRGWWSAAEPPWRTSCAPCCCHSHISDRKNQKHKHSLGTWITFSDSDLSTLILCCCKILSSLDSHQINLLWVHLNFDGLKHH